MKHLNHLNHLKPLFCTFSLGLFLAAAAHAQSGTTGACTWRIDGDTLYIEGAGAMANYDNSINRAPWYVYHDNLSRLVIGDGVTSIGNYAFDGCGGFTNYLILPAGLTSIGDYAFSGCIWFEIVYARNPTPPTLGTGVFDGWNLGGVILWTPFAALSSYSAISPWKEFFSIEGTAQVIYDYRYDNLKDTVPEISSGQTGIVLTAPTQPARDGYTFGGWHSDTASLTSLWVFANDAVTGDTVLYAVWFENFDDTFKPVSTCAFSDGVVSLEKRIFTEEPYRPNFDGTKYYKSELAVGVALNGKKVLTVIPAVTGLYAAMTSDRMGRPSMLVDTVRKEIWVFSNSKTASVD
ncbi:MAG: leucine-rich repeat protein, partial [Bacteroidales bacterium]|nr:leucine-rich repeat protein [Bacteroidales bacterium]